MISQEDLDYLNQLEHSRVEARILRDKGLEAIVAFSLKDDHWDQEISDNEKVLFRRAKHLAWNLGKIEEYDCDNEAQYYPRPTNQIEPRVNYPQWPLIALPLLRENDLKNPTGLLKSLKNSQANPLAKYIRSHLKSSPSEKLRDYKPSSGERFPLRAFLSVLNKVMREESLHKHAVESKIQLRPETQALLDQAPEGADLLRLNRMLLHDAYPHEIAQEVSSVELFNMPAEPAPILFAANYLRTKLGNLDGYLDESTLACYYRVVRELFNLHNTKWALGAARPGEESGTPSVFVTMECARAIGYFARLMENTAQFLTRISETRSYVQHVRCSQRNGDELDVPSLLPAWCASELDWCLASVKTTIEAYRDYVALLLPDLKDITDLEKIIGLVEQSVRDFARQSEESFRVVIEWSTILRQREGGTFKTWRKKERNPKQKPSRRQLPEPDLTQTAHLVAWGALVAARQDFKKLSNKTDDHVLTEAAAVFGSLSKWLRTHLDPSKEYFERTLHRCLVENGRGGRPNIVQDLAFSALSVGLITKEWERPDCLQAIKILCENLDEQGHFPGGLPFVYSSKGEGRIVINAQVVRAFAQLAQHMAPNVNSELTARIPRVAGRMIRYFNSHAIELGKGIAWPSLRARERGSLWITAISVLALHRIVLMLDAHINHGVKKHFNTKSAAELKKDGVPYLHELMCSDVGYVSVCEDQKKNPQRVVMELEGMRAHLVGAGRAKRRLRAKEGLGDLPVRSMILYGPPGTGKTTLVKSLAVTSNVDLVEVMSHDLYRPGTEKVIEQTSYVMDALKLLTSAVILFDEFEPILHPRPEIAKSITEMLTGNMLPKLDALYKSAGQNGTAYVLSTNYVERLEPAAIRAGRFDRITFIYYPDAASRACRLISEYRHLLNRLTEAGIKMPDTVDSAPFRLMEIVGMTAQRYINHLCRTGWLVAPREIRTAGPKTLASQTEDALRPVWRYVIWNEPSPEIGWQFFGAAETMISTTQNPKTKTQDETRIIEIVQSWDREIRTMVRVHSDASWRKMLEILARPIRL